MAGGLALPPGGPPGTVTPKELTSFSGNTQQATNLGDDMVTESNNDTDSALPQDFNLDDIDVGDLFGDAPSEQYPMPPPLQTPMYPPMQMQGNAKPSFHPDVGWYLPIQQQFPPLPPPPPSSFFPMAQEGYTPASSTPFSSAIPSGVSTPMPSAPPPSAPFLAPPPPRNRSKQKRKYGPAAYLEEQAKSRAAGNPEARAVSVSQAEYTSKAKQRDDRENGLVVQNRYRKKNAPSIVQACICNDRETLKIKRPKNAFILYRSANSAQIMKRSGTNNNQILSKVAGEQWRNESPEVKQKYNDLAELEKQRHMANYPNYKYTPGISNKNKFGSENCQCGAYQVNLQALQARKAARAANPARGPKKRSGYQSDDESEPDALDEYVPPASPPRQHPAPPAQMYQPPLPDPSALNFALPAQRAQASDYLASMKRKRAELDAEIANFEEQPPAKRCSPRHANHDVSYLEPDEDDFGSVPTPQRQEKRRPSPITTAVPPVEDTPAQNTRSKSMSPKGTIEDFDFDAWTAQADQIDWEAWAADPNADAAFEDDNADDNIVVARRRSSSKSPRSTRQKGAKGSPTRSPKSQPGSRKSSGSRTYHLRSSDNKDE